jgi:succinate dehydrogenase/fumarate reductase-like Fe-S protein
MFNKTKNKIKELLHRQDLLETRILELEEGQRRLTFKFKVCDKCGCLVAEERAVKGESKIEIEKKLNFLNFSTDYQPQYEETEEEVIKKVWYCQKCKPKK